MKRFQTLLSAGAALLSAALAPNVAISDESPVPVTAETVAKRIDLAGRQRMLSQRMAKYLCFARSNVNPAESASLLQASMALFGETHTYLKTGNTDLDLFEETSPRVLEAWQALDGYWQPLQRIYTDALGGKFIDEAGFDRINMLTNDTLKHANDLVVANRGTYAEFLGDGAVGEALLIDLYGRQRMLSQKLSKEVCQVAASYDLDVTLPELKATLDLFENSLTAFINGYALAGIPKPPTEEIAAQLALAEAEWLPVRQVAADVAAGKAVNLSDLGRLADGTDGFLVEMNKAVGMLAAYNKAQS
ncbi:MAG: type IV pili methyl-accepting chemotaxis transducer N-terminal domain-containing protein [Pseudomonadota bacterium]